MILTKPQPGESFSQEEQALQKRRCLLLVELVELADRIARIDTRLHKLRSYGEMDRCGETGKATTEAADESTKKAGEA